MKRKSLLELLLLQILCLSCNNWICNGEIQNNVIISLSKLNVDKDGITISGFSAGASMTTQLHVAHSSLFHGAAIFSQAFYRCGPNSLVEFGLRCSPLGLGIFPYQLEKALEDVRRYEGEGLIDPVTNLKKQRVFIWMGLLDEYVLPEMAIQNFDFYKNFISNPNTSISWNVFRAKHLYPTTNFGNKCDEDASQNEYLGNCNYSGVYNSLEFLLRDKITRKMVFPENDIALTDLQMYNQSEFYEVGKIKEVGMGTLGFIYIPTKCQDPNRKCFLHLNFHGCNEWPPKVAKKYIINSGFLPVAEANEIILVFPLSTKVPQNMDGCWDFFSFTGKHFATKKGSQIKVIRGIIDRILTGQ